MRGFDKWHAEHQKRSDPRVAEMMVHLRRAFEIFETLMLSSAEPTKAPQPPTEVVVQHAPKDPHASVVVRPKVAKQMLSCSTTRLYDLINSGQLESFMVGKARCIPVKAIEDYVARQLAAHKARGDTASRPARAFATITVPSW